MDKNDLLFIIILLISSIFSLLAVKWSYFKVLLIAKMKRIVDNPDARKFQKEPVPVLGGVVVFLGVIAGMLVGTVSANACGLELSVHLLPIVCAMILMLYVGAMDDIIGLTPFSRFTIEVVAILVLIFAGGNCVDNFYGMWGINEISWWIAVPLTVFAGVGIINAINMIDGVNGLSSGLCIVCSIMFGVAFVRLDDVSNAILAFSMAAALVPFFMHNVFGNKSRMFIGDAGTMVMGIMLTWFVISTIRSGISTELDLAHDVKNMIAMSLAMLSLPVFDTVRVMTMRMMKRQSPFHPDKTHLHHAFVSVGLSHLFTSAIEICIDCLITGIWVITLKCRLGLEMQLYIVVLSSMVFVWGGYWLTMRSAEKKTKFYQYITEKTSAGQVKHAAWVKWMEKKMDYPQYNYVKIALKECSEDQEEE